MGKRELCGRKVTTRALAPPPPPPLPLHKSSERETALKVQLGNGKVMTWGGGGTEREEGIPPPPKVTLWWFWATLCPLLSQGLRGPYSQTTVGSPFWGGGGG